MSPPAWSMPFVRPGSWSTTASAPQRGPSVSCDLIYLRSCTALAKRPDGATRAVVRLTPERVTPSETPSGSNIFVRQLFYGKQGRATQMIRFLAEVTVMLADHLDINVAEQLRHRRNRHTSGQTFGVKVWRYVYATMPRPRSSFSRIRRTRQRIALELHGSAYRLRNKGPEGRTATRMRDNVIMQGVR